jgi:CheY-like chemotaxis protein
VTGYAEAADLDKCAEAGFARHIKKPVEFPKLLEAVNELADPLPGNPKLPGTT